VENGVKEDEVEFDVIAKRGVASEPCEVGRGNEKGVLSERQSGRKGQKKEMG